MNKSLSLLAASILSALLLSGCDVESDTTEDTTETEVVESTDSSDESSDSTDSSDDSSDTSDSTDSTDDSDSSDSTESTDDESYEAGETSSAYSAEDLEAFTDAEDLSGYYSESEITALLDTAITAVKGEVISFDDDLYSDYSDDDYTELDGDSGSYSITEAGTYVLSGDISSTVTVEVGEEEDVRLVLNDVSITSSDGPAIVIITADDVEISAVSGTENYLEDASTRASTEEEEYTGALHSECDLVLNGSGSIDITANYNNALITKDDLMLINLSMDISSVDDGITGKDSLSVSGATITVDADGDALKSTKDDDTEKGFVFIESGIFDLTAGDDALAAETLMVIYDGSFAIDAGGKGLQSETDIAIGGGDFTISSVDHAIDSNVDMAIYAGDFEISTDEDTDEGDGLKATESLEISGGTIDIVTALEGIEAQYLTINGGYITANTTDDALNAASDYSDNTLTMNGGMIVLSSYGDTVDVNGAAEINGGTIIANGPTSYQSNATFDVDDGYDVNAGTIFAFGNSSMAKAPSSSSEQPSIEITLSTYYNEQTWVTLSDESGDTIMTLYALNAFDHLILSHEDLEIGSTYTVDIGDSASVDVTLSSEVTSIDESGDSAESGSSTGPSKN